MSSRDLYYYGCVLWRCMAVWLDGYWYDTLWYYQDGFLDYGWSS